MIFPQVGQYALRIMTALAQAPEGDPVRAKDLAVSTAVPATYLSKVCRRLTTAGLLTSRRGHHGGFRLARSPDLITFAQVLDAVDALPSSSECAFGWGSCDRQTACPLHPHWFELSHQVQTWATTATLEDVIDS